MNPLDIAFIAVIGFGLVKIMQPHFSGTLFFLFKLFSSIAASIMFYPFFTRILLMAGGGRISANYFPIIAFLMQIGFWFSVFYILERAYVYGNKAKEFHLAKALGGLAWMATLIYLFSLATNITENSRMVEKETTAESNVYPYIEPVARFAHCQMDNIFQRTSKIRESFILVLNKARDLSVGTCLPESTATNSTQNRPTPPPPTQPPPATTTTTTPTTSTNTNTPLPPHRD
ncbi:MAG: hypothetical protein IPI59_07360 [Sphingobacteriales bacterium]|jgi:hypothetical protein|nr:hypothetical protein [Sphingobacteriales bacterium]MBP9140433.1 hypothetical protein [Chitinophagales bacterium]MDA0197302.1 hypothetical protein [Bacteroidota bacterium]MBK7527352.1 hypothetical protein [Sphingobacteriales bacterium]MBK8678298.1 hypothetical protein [Sphingobacteriales bacterium]